MESRLLGGEWLFVLDMVGRSKIASSMTEKGSSGMGNAVAPVESSRSLLLLLLLMPPKSKVGWFNISRSEESGNGKVNRSLEFVLKVVRSADVEAGSAGGRKFNMSE